MDIEHRTSNAEHRIFFDRKAIRRLVFDIQGSMFSNS